MEGLRHAEAVTALRQVTEPLPAFLFYLDLPAAEGLARANTRDGTPNNPDAAHPVEQDLPAVRALADLIVPVHSSDPGHGHRAHPRLSHRAFAGRRHGSALPVSSTPTSTCAGTARSCCARQATSTPAANSACPAATSKTARTSSRQPSARPARKPASPLTPPQCADWCYPSTSATPERHTPASGFVFEPEWWDGEPVNGESAKCRSPGTSLLSPQRTSYSSKPARSSYSYVATSH